MKFTGSFQCLMGGNAVQFHDQSSSSSVLAAATRSSSILLPADNNTDDKKNISSSVATKKTKTKTKKKKKKKTDRKVIRVFRPDGEINLYNKPVKVSEVMIDEYMVCRSDSFYIGQKIPPLSQHERLERGHTYFLLPAHLFHSVLSFVTIASFTAWSSKQKEIDVHETASNAANMKMKAAFLKKAAASSCSPFDIQKTPSGTLSIRVSEMFISQLMMEKAATTVASSHDQHDDDKELLADVLCTTPQLHRDYNQLVVGSRRCWKPKLEMIKETPPKGKRKVKLLLSASISRMKKKMKKHKNVGVPDHQISSSSSSSASASKKNNKKNKKTVKPAVTLRPSSSVKANKFSKIK